MEPLSPSIELRKLLLWLTLACFSRKLVQYGGVDSVKSTVSVLEEGDFSEEGGGFNWRGYFSVGGYQFLWRKESSASGVGVILRWGRGGL